MKTSIIENLNWNKGNGLVPAIVQDSKTLQVLMLGYMDKAALQQTFVTHKVTFYSRSKQRLWTKGESSGNELKLMDIAMDCDEDTLLILAEPAGPCCHKNTMSCFNELSRVEELTILPRLEKRIDQRYQERPDNSYVSQLFSAGMQRIAQKVGEEGVEVALASMANQPDEIKNEAADLLFHLLILLRQNNLQLVDVLAELQKRFSL